MCIDITHCDKMACTDLDIMKQSIKADLQRIKAYDLKGLKVKVNDVEKQISIDMKLSKHKLHFCLELLFYEVGNESFGSYKLLILFNEEEYSYEKLRFCLIYYVSMLAKDVSELRKSKIWPLGDLLIT